MSVETALASFAFAFAVVVGAAAVVDAVVAYFRHGPLVAAAVPYWAWPAGVECAS